MENKYPDYPIIDMHLHLPIEQDDWLKPYREKYIEEYGERKWSKLLEMEEKQPSWLPMFGFQTPEKASADYIAVSDRWYEEAKANNLKKVFFLTGGGNDILSEAVKRHEDVFCGFCHHPITDKDSAQKLERGIRTQGLSGYKILAPLIEKPLESKEFEETFEVCHEYRLPVNVHFGILGGGGGVSGGANISPQALGSVAKRFPNANFIVPHFGCGFTNDLLRLMWASPNVYVDTSGNNLWTKWTMENYSLEQLFSRFLDTVGAQRIIFGTDSEWFPRGFAKKYLELQYKAMQDVGASEEDQRSIFVRNAESLIENIKR